MSTILKALRRLEEQKTSGAERPLREEIVLAPKRSGARSGLARALVAAMVLAGAGTALIWALRNEPERSEPVAGATLSEVAAAPPAEAPHAASTITVTAPAAEPPGAVVPVPAAPQEFEIVRPDASAPSNPLAPVPLPTIQREEVLAEEPPPAPPVGRSGVRPPPEEYVDEPLEAPPQSRFRDAGAAKLARGGAPVHVARTLWHPDPDRRLAWVEVEGQTALREVREGERIGSYVVREIGPTAVLFSDGDTEIRREVGP